MLSKYPFFKVLQILVKNPKQQYSVRGLAKAASISPSAAKTVLDWLFAHKFLEKKVIGKTYQYSPNTDYFLVKHVKILHSLFEISNSGLVEELSAKYPLISLCLYGSVARGEDDSSSDIDLLLIVRKSVKLGAVKAEGKLGREAAYLVYTPAEWKLKAQKDRVFYERVILDAIPLFGEVPVV